MALDGSASLLDPEMFDISASQAANNSFLLALSPCTKFELILTFDKHIKQDLVKKTKIHYPLFTLTIQWPASATVPQAMGKGRQQPAAGSLG